jgi:membrane fusion protein, adhesin transport system
MEIVPAEDSLLIEVWILHQDVAFLRPGLEANVSITAYDPSIYGTLDAVLENISADTFTNDQGMSLYRVNLRAGTNRFGKKGKKLPIIPGMTASADILTGKRTILYYLLKPIHRLQTRALKEM